MTELRFEGGEARRDGRSAWAGRLRRPLFLVVVTLLCCAAYLAGVWYGMQGGITCTVTSPGRIVCGDGDTPPPAQQARPPKESGSA